MKVGKSAFFSAVEEYQAGKLLKVRAPWNFERAAAAPKAEL